jgi:hypothetical protein
VRPCYHFFPYRCIRKLISSIMEIICNFNQRNDRNFSMREQIVSRSLTPHDNTVTLLSSLIMMKMMMLMILVSWEYVSELRPQTALLLIPHAIYEYGEPWWNVVDKGKLIRQPELSGSPTNSHLAAWRRIWWIWLSKCLCSYIEVTSYIP